MMSGLTSEPSRFSGMLWVVDPPEVDPESWLNDPGYEEFRAAYDYASRHFTVLGQLLGQHGLTAENACLIWKCIETGRAVMRFRERQGVRR